MSKRMWASLVFGGYLIFLPYLLGLPMASQEGSSYLPFPSPKHRVQDIFFLDAQQGWLGVDGGEDGCWLLRTSDEGQSWQVTQVQKCLWRLYFVDVARGWGVSMKANEEEVSILLLSTQDGGKSWLQTSVLTTSEASDPRIVTDLAFLDAQRGWFVGEAPARGFALETMDGGKTVREVPGLAGRVSSLYRVVASSRSSLWVIGNDTIAASMDAGESWRFQVSRNNTPGGRKHISLRSGWMQPDGRGVAVGQNTGAVVISTRNYGEDWGIAFTSVEANDFEDIYFWDGEHGCAVGGSRYLYCTNDGGATWRGERVLPVKEAEDFSIVENVFTHVVILPSGRGWVVTGGGYIYETHDFGDTWQRVDIAALLGVADAEGPASHN
jgi:photosystem II stability/assembly factor-like uncharacterized protein